MKPQTPFPYHNVPPNTRHQVTVSDALTRVLGQHAQNVESATTQSDNVSRALQSSQVREQPVWAEIDDSGALGNGRLRAGHSQMTVASS
jgi:hypothetical protein